MWMTLSRFFRWLFRADRPLDTVVEDYLRKNREALEAQRRTYADQSIEPTP